ncbi:phosphomevalonate kinase [Malassezia cuniculi]|uniref:Phosphomevalonate kinase n=1 Tax=Malassezia cuniculi TaxID=948313 RepID=A0AAF0JAQ5_9BASI|nr:phosphomevalonate kinase [Malassezia cuniculi]
MTTTTSAPGKALLAGGYLVLDPAYPGIVIAADARFYTTVRPLHQRGKIVVRSPQFQQGEWTYSVSTEDSLQVEYDAASPGGRNPFVATTLYYALHVALEASDDAAARIADGLEIIIAGDNDYYSQRIDGRALSLDELRALEPFRSHSCTIGEVHKTGLGSSAAMTTSLASSLLVHLGAARGDGHQLDTESLALIHNVAQIAHCAAQGKLGSGFDVSSAVWGSQLYRRFDPSIISGLLEEEAHGPLLPTISPRNPLWQPSPKSAADDTAPTAIEGLAAQTYASDDIYRPPALVLPPGVRLCLADVDAGSNTRTLVGSVSTWRKEKPEWAAQLYRVIGAANQSLADGLLSLHVAYANDPATYAAVHAALASMHSAKWDAYRDENPSHACSAFIDVRNSIRSVRAGMRELGVQSGAPVEPPEMTELVSASVDAAPGILGGGVPGAGGYDAMYILWLPEHPTVQSPPQGLLDLWSTWRDLSVGALTCEAAEVLPIKTSSAGAFVTTAEPPAGASLQNALVHVAATLRAANGGVRVENAENIPGLSRFL